ncbi:uncharacterized protein LOC143027756 isoform X2 [Oratosquilla oratoria]|uniref:uncharacterized protein LOC143027756 isoform X2 n=1 Tax=Oratosquilla oratoria TaxID=337810 RepID=UPI003F7590DD
MEKPPKHPSSLSNSPSKSQRKCEQKVQFAQEAEDLLSSSRSHKLSRSCELTKSSSASNCRSGSQRYGYYCGSSTKSSSHSSDKPQSKVDTRWTYSLDRKRAGSLRNRGTSRPVSDASRSQSLDRRRAEFINKGHVSPNASSEKKEAENDSSKSSVGREQSHKSKAYSHNRSHSCERLKSGKQKLSSSTLNQLPKNTDAKKEDKKGETKSEDKESKCQTSSWGYRIRRAISRSPHRPNMTNQDINSSKEEKENDKPKEKVRITDSHRRHEGRERGRSLKRENRSARGHQTNKNKSYSLEDSWVIEDEIMWTGSGSRRCGYLLFNYTNLDKSPNINLPAKRYGMTFKFSQCICCHQLSRHSSTINSPLRFLPGTPYFPITPFIDCKLIRMLMETHGFSEVDNMSQNFNLYWSNAHFNPNEIRQLQDWQKVNHFPRSSELTRKDRLYMNIKRMQRQFGVKLFDFIPTSFVLPSEYRDFCDTHLRERGTWIVKPVASSQGKGIYLITQANQVPSEETSLVCRYIESPLLVDGYKCDLRLYVAVTSLDPMVVYLYEEGLVRLATVKYQHGKNLWNPCIHLTNYSVNKFHSNYVQNEDPEVDDQGNKWSLSALLRYLKCQGVDTGALMRAVEDVIIKSLLAAAYQMNTATNMFVPYPRNCFELYGFDILIDSQLKPWVLEVNLSPSLNIDQPLDLKIKSAMLSDLFSLVGVQACNPHTAKVNARPSIYRKLPSLISSPAHMKLLLQRYTVDSFDRSQYGRDGAIVPSAEELRIVKYVREEYVRRGGWARIFPTPDSWAMYGTLQEYDSPLNYILHYHLYPQGNKTTSRFGRLAPMRISSVSSSGLASSLERLACYERALPKGLANLKNKKNLENKKEDRLTKDMRHIKNSVMKSLENGLQLSKYQARMAFSVYLQHIQRRLMIGCDAEKQTDLVYKFLRSATRTLHYPMNVQAPSKTLPGEARAVVISKQLGDFIQAYTKETNLYLDHGTSASCSSLSSHCPTTSTCLAMSEPSTPMNATAPSPSLQEPSTSSITTSSSSSTSSGHVLYSSSASSQHVPPISSSSSSSYLTTTSNSSSASLFSSMSASSTSSINSPPSASSMSPTSASTTSLNTAVSDTETQIQNWSGTASNETEKTDPKPSGSGGETQEQKEDHITMDLYRAFMSNAGETDLEEILTLQTRMHNSAGVFLDSARRPKLSHAHSGSLRSTSPPVQSASTRTRTPTSSPHGSPRRARRSPSTSSQLKSSDPVTSEPQAFNQGSTDERSTSPQQSVSSLSTDTTASTMAPSSSTNTTTSGSCCLFGNILKASLKGTNTFIS